MTNGLLSCLTTASVLFGGIGEIGEIGVPIETKVFSKTLIPPIPLIPPTDGKAVQFEWPRMVIRGKKDGGNIPSDTKISRSKMVFVQKTFQLLGHEGFVQDEVGLL